MEETLRELDVILEHAGHVCRQAGIVFANGWLTIGYFLSDNGALLASLLSLVAILWGENRTVERIVGRSLRTGERSSIPLSHRWQQILTVAIGLVWAVICLRTPSPVPQIGAAMWVVSAIYIARSTEVEVAWRLKGFLVMYAVAAPALEFLLRLNLFYSSPHQWARYLDLPVEATAASTEQFNTILLQIALTVMRYGVPFAFLWYVAQRVGVHVPGWFAPGRSREQAARRMRYRK